jgi:hypothetical protein
MQKESKTKGTFPKERARERQSFHELSAVPQRSPVWTCFAIFWETLKQRLKLNCIPLYSTYFDLGGEFFSAWCFCRWRFGTGDQISVTRFFACTYVTYVHNPEPQYWLVDSGASRTVIADSALGQYKILKERTLEEPLLFHTDAGEGDQGSHHSYFCVLSFDSEKTRTWGHLRLGMWRAQELSHELRQRATDVGQAKWLSGSPICWEGRTWPVPISGSLWRAI